MRIGGEAGFRKTTPWAVAVRLGHDGAGNEALGSEEGETRSGDHAGGSNRASSRWSVSSLVAVVGQPMWVTRRVPRGPHRLSRISRTNGNPQRASEADLDNGLHRAYPRTQHPPVSMSDRVPKHVHVGSRPWRVLAGLCALVLALPACTSAGSAGSPHQNGPPRGGTLRLAAIPRNRSPATVSLQDPAFLDPRRPYGQYTFEGELFRCCLARTLLSYTSEELGTVLSPDVASQMPEVSPDGLTWTFRLKEGLRYAPPLEDVEITASDFVRGIERPCLRR